MIEQIANILNEKMYNILEAMRPISLLNEKKKKNPNGVQPS